MVATLASESGRRVWPRNDFYRIGEGCRAAEQRYDLRATGERDRTAAKRPTRAETEKATRTGGQVPVRVALRREVRAAAGGAGSVEAFFARLRDVGLDGARAAQRARRGADRLCRRARRPGRRAGCAGVLLRR